MTSSTFQCTSGVTFHWEEGQGGVSAKGKSLIKGSLHHPYHRPSLHHVLSIPTVTGRFANLWNSMTNFKHRIYARFYVLNYTQ